MQRIILELLAMSYPLVLAAIGHMVVVKLGWFKKLTYPLDHYLTFKNKRLFGDNKTYRGLLVMVLSLEVLPVYIIS